MHVREMTQEDIPRVSDLLCACYRWLGEKETFSSKKIEFLIEKRGSADTVEQESQTETYFVACDGPKIAGMVSVKGNEITKLYVDPPWHRKGFGRVLFEKAEEIITGNGHPKIILGAIGQTPVPFYESMGMTISGRKPCRMAQESAQEIVLMEKAISQNRSITMPSRGR